MKLSIYAIPLSLYLITQSVLSKYSVSDLKVSSDPWNTIKLYPEVKNVDSIIALKGTAIILKSLGNDNVYSLVISRINPNTNQERQMLSHMNRGACDNMKKYIGFILTEVETLAGVPNPGTCPIAKGNYTLREWFKVNLNKVPLFTMVPSAIYRLNITVFDNYRKTVHISVALKFIKN